MKSRTGAGLWLFAVLVAGWPLHLAAQIGAGTVTGRVVNAATQQPLSDVVVTATAPELQGEQIVVTDKSGLFRIPNLPPGEYALQIEAAEFHPLSRPGIEVRSGVTLRLELQLLPQVLAAEEVTVVAAPPTVDVGSARTGLTLNQDFTSRIPVAPPSGKGGGTRSFEQLAELAPTGRGDTYGASLMGTTSPENVYLIDGLSVSDPGFGYNATPLSIDFIKETNIITGGYLPEYGRGGGGVLEVITKSGSNEFHGSVYGNLTPWSAAPGYLAPQDAISTIARIDSARDVGFDLGGPIVKDKLWFYLGAAYSAQSYTMTRDLNVLDVDDQGQYVRNGDGNISSQRIPGTRRVSIAQLKSFQYLGKLTFSPTPDDRIELIHRGTPSRSGGNGTYDIDYETGLPHSYGTPSTSQLGPYAPTGARKIFDSYGTTAKWTHSSFEKRLTFDTTLGWQYERSANLAPDGTNPGGGGLSALNQFYFQRTGPQHSINDFENIGDASQCANPMAPANLRCPVPIYYLGGMGLSEDRHFHTYQARELATLLANGLGHHVIKAGVDLEYQSYNSLRSWSGGWRYSENAAGTATSNSPYGFLSAPDTPNYMDQHYTVSTLSVGAFLQDSWSIMDKVTLNAGLRYDSQTLYAGSKVGLSFPNQWSPRVGLVWDPTQSGRAKLFANYAIYYQTFPLDIMARGGIGEAVIQGRRRYADCNPFNSDYPGRCTDPALMVHNPNNNDAAIGPNDKYYVSVIGRAPIDPDIKPQSSNELSGGGELEIIPNGRLGLTYVHRNMNQIVEDLSRDEGVTLLIANPGRALGTGYPRARRDYDAGILSFTKIFADSWLAQASYTLSYLRGNWEGLFRSQTSQLDPGANSDYDLKSLLVNRTGDLAGDRRHEIKVFLAKDIALGKLQRVTIGAGYQTRSGGPTNYLGRDRLYGRGEVFLLPRGGGERLPWVHNFDLHVGYTFLQTKSNTLAITFDAFNLFNFQQVTNVGQNYTNRPVAPILGSAQLQPFVNGNRRTIDPTRIMATDLDQNPRPFDNTDRNLAFGAPSMYQAPLTIRVGIKSTF